MKEIIIGVIIPFLGTVLGSSMVFLMKNKLNSKVEKALSGFAAGVMVAAAVWSLLIPSIEMSDSLGKFSFFPAAIGFIFGIFFLLFLDTVIPHLHVNSEVPEGVNSKKKMNRSTMLVLAVTLHNIPEGMTVGVVLASVYYGNISMSMAGALTLAVGIAMQNFPEGAIISMPLKETGLSKTKSFLYGMFSGIVEPIAAALTILLISVVNPVLPYLLSFAAGAMIYVVVEELIPSSQDGGHSNIGTVGVALGFVIMMILDIAFG